MHPRPHSRSFLAFALILTLCGTVSAAFDAGDSLYIDFGRNDTTNGIIMPLAGTMNTEAGNSTGVPDAFGNYWNNAWMDTANPGGNTPVPVINLITSTNDITDVFMTFSNGWQANGFNNGGLLAPDESLLGEFASINATGDYFFFNNADSSQHNPVSMTFMGLDPSLVYDFKIFASRLQTNAGDIRNSIYSITDANGTHSFTLQTTGLGIGAGGYNGNNDEFATFAGIVPTETGEITLSLTNGAGSSFAYIGALQLTAVPEPGTLALLEIGGIAGLAFLRGTRFPNRRQS